MESHTARLTSDYSAQLQALTELAHYLDTGNMDDYFGQPTQSKQDALQKALKDWREARDVYYQEAFGSSEADARFAVWQSVFMALGLVIVLIAVWYGIRHVLLNPLRQVIDHISDIADGNLGGTLKVDGRNEISELATSVKQMQQALIVTVGSVRRGSDAIYTGMREIAAGNSDLSSRTEQQAASLEQTATSMEELTATVKLNADNAHQATTLAHHASDTADRGGEVAQSVIETMHGIADSSQKNCRHH